MLNPMALIALLSLPLIYWLHKFHKKPPVKLVSSLYLWPQYTQRPKSGTKKTRFVQSVSFWLELFMALLVCALLIQPSGCDKSGVHHTLVVDTSVSMNATNLEQALLNRISEASAEDRFTIIGAGYGARLLGEYQDKQTAQNTVQSLAFVDSTAGLQTAISLAETVSIGKVEVWTDQPTKSQKQLEWHTLAQKADNIGITQAQWNQNMLELGITNASTQSHQINITVYKLDDGQSKTPMDIQNPTSTLEPNSDAVLTLPMNERAEHLIVSIQSTTIDLLTEDNTVHLHTVANQSLSVARTMDNKMASALGLYSSRADAPVFTLLPNPVEETPMKADLLFTSRDLGGGPSTWRVHFAPVKTPKWTQHIFAHSAHPLLEGVDTSNSLWEYDADRRLRGQILMDADGVPLLTEERDPTGHKRILHFNIGPNSGFLRSPSWPILLSNIIQARLDQLDGFNVEQAHLGEIIRGTGLENGTWTVRHFDGVKSSKDAVNVQNGTLAITAEDIGVYQFINPIGSLVHSTTVNLLTKSETLLVEQEYSVQQSPLTPEKIERPASHWQVWIWLLLIGLTAWNWKATS